MANIKISELNELYGHQRSYDDYIPVVDSSTNETKKISVKSLIPNNVNIIAVTDTAPVEYETGDKYYNTDENKIYTATSWGWENPETPIGGILYVILAEQKTYTYDGDNETLVSVGSASGSVVNNYSTSTIEGYSCNYVNEAISGAIVSTYTNNQTSAYSTEYINNMMDYSTSEVDTGRKWIDGKTIYRKVLNLTAPNATGTYASIGNIGVNIDTIIRFDAFIDLGTYGIVPLPIANDSSNIVPIAISNKTNGVISMSIQNTAYKSKAVNIIVEYTKSS